MQVSEYLFSWLADYGVRDVFMVSGGGAMFLNNALGHEKRIRYVCNHHEQAVAIAVEGYARVTNRLGVALVTTGPGGTNTLTGVIGEWLDSIPALFISGQVKFATTILSRPDLPLRQLGDQEINIVDLVRPVTKYAVTVTDPTSIRYHVEKAVWYATHGRKGPVWLDIPINVQMAEINPEELPGFAPEIEAGIGAVCPPDSVRQMTCKAPMNREELLASGLMETIAEKLLAAKSPLIVCGQGVRLADAIPEFKELLEKTLVPAVMSFNGFDILPTSHPQRIGGLGTIGTRASNIALQSADFVLTLGTRNNIRQISYNYENFARNAKDLVVVDIDDAELRKGTVKPTLPVQADVKDFLILLNDSLARYSEMKPAAHAQWLKWVQEKREKYSPVLPEYANVQGGVQPYWFTEKLTQQIAEDAVLGCANATPSITLFQCGIIKDHQRFFCNSGCAAMGFGFPASIGAAFAAGKRQMICLEGDGSLMMNLQELQTVRHWNLPMKLFLFNNGEYASIRQTHDNFFGGWHTACDAGSGVTFPDWEKIAGAFDWKYFRIDSHEDLDGKIREILNEDGPVFTDVKLVSNYTFSPKLSSRRFPDGTIVSASLEDMYPFLPEDEMKTNYYHANGTEA